MARQADTVGLPKRLPLVAMPDNRDESTRRDAKLVNGYVEKDEFTGDFHIYKRPGLAEDATLSESGNGLGCYNWQGDVYAIFGSSIYKNGVALTGSVNTAGGMYRWSSTLGATPNLQFGNGAATYNTDGSTFAAISGANFPTTTVKGIGYLDGTIYVMDSTAATIHGSDDLNDPVNWTDLLNVIEAQIEPDGPVALAKQLVYILALKEWSTEIFYDAQNATGSPLGPVQGAKINYGCANADSIQEMDGVLFWLSTNRSSSPQIIKVDNLKFEIVSTPAIDRLIGDADLTAVRSFAIKYEGHKFYGISFVNTNITLVYDAAQRIWAQWTDSSGNYFPVVATTFSSDNELLLQHATNGKMYMMDTEYFTDDGSVITFDLYTPNFDGGINRRKQMNSLVFVGDQRAGSVLQVRWNDEDYTHEKWSNFRKVDMNTPRPLLPFCGTFRRRAHHIRHQCNTPLRLQAIEMQLDLGVI